MCAALSYPRAKTMTLGIRRTGPCGQLQVGVEVHVKREAERWVFSPQCWSFLEGQDSWIFDSFSYPFCSICQVFKLVTPKSLPSGPPSESLLPGPPSVHFPMAQTWEGDLGA